MNPRGTFCLAISRAGFDFFLQPGLLRGRHRTRLRGGGDGQDTPADWTGRINTCKQLTAPGSRKEVVAEASVDAGGDRNGTEMAGRGAGSRNGQLTRKADGGSVLQDEGVPEMGGTDGCAATELCT